jgi:hypothetical protein
MTEPRTETLDVPGASLRFDTRGVGDSVTN